MKKIMNFVSILLFTILLFSCDKKHEIFPRYSENQADSLLEIPIESKFTYHYLYESEIEASFYKDRIPEEYYEAFIYYTRNFPELRMHFYSIMVHESINFKVFKSKNSNGSYDLGPSHLNTRNIENPYFRELYNPEDESRITSLYCSYMVMSINYFKDMVNKFDGNIINAYYAYNGGQKAPSVINAKHIPSSKRDFVRKVRAYGNSIDCHVTKFTEEYNEYKRDIVEKILLGIDYLNRNYNLYPDDYIDVFFTFDKNNNLQMKLLRSISKTSNKALGLNNLSHNIRNDIIVNIRREDYIPEFVEEKKIIDINTIISIFYKYC